ncbi:MAG: hypothetical protein JW719_06805, partial [Pirellulales bacterium]|nr:hypothetical protein [Pirellulales bacterium]
MATESCPFDAFTVEDRLAFGQSGPAEALAVASVSLRRSIRSRHQYHVISAAMAMAQSTPNPIINVQNVIASPHFHGKKGSSMNGPLPNRAVALVAQLGRTERLAKPHGQPQAKRDDRQQKLFAVVDGVVMIRDVFSASGTTNGFGICHKAPFLQLKICNSK